MNDSENNTPQQPHENPKRVQLAQEAERLIMGQRLEDYGTPEKNFSRIARYWSIRLEDKLQEDEEITPREVAELMLLVKVARATQSPTEDSYVDGIGYAAIAGELADLERKRKQEEKYAELAEDPEFLEKKKAREEWIKYCRETGGDGK